jgi:ribonuclease VapC
MIVDSSALIAILRGEPEREAMIEAIVEANRRLMSAATWLETAIVVDSRDDPVLSRRYEDLVQALGIQVDSVTSAQSVTARQAFRDFGKGRHRAGLDFGDCFAYALAVDMKEPLLCKGDDFRHTDVEVVDLAP